VTAGLVARLVIGALAVATAGAPAHAETAAIAAGPLDLPDTPAELTLPAGWTPLPLPPTAAVAPLGAWHHPSGATLVVTRAAAPNPDAWREKTRAAHAEEVEAGTRAAAPRYQRRERRLLDVAGVPAMELSFRRAVGASGREREVVSIRFLFFRTHTVSVAIAVPEKRWNRARGVAKAGMAALALPAGYAP
jgi:hypothetical protein